MATARATIRDDECYKKRVTLSLTFFNLWELDPPSRHRYDRFVQKIVDESDLQHLDLWCDGAHLDLHYHQSAGENDEY